MWGWLGGWSLLCWPPVVGFAHARPAERSTARRHTKNRDFSRLTPPLHPLRPPALAGQYGRTALMWAALNGHDQTAKILLDNGAKPNVASKVRSPKRSHGSVASWAGGCFDSLVSQTVLSASRRACTGRLYGAHASSGERAWPRVQSAH